MYNSSIKGQGSEIAHFGDCMEVPHKIFFNDMSKNYMCEEFKSCDVIYSEISWLYGYKGFNENAKNEPAPYRDYVTNINKLIEELDVPAFIVCGKNVAHFFPKATAYPFAITTSGTNMSGCQLYVWKYHYNNEGYGRSNVLLSFLAEHFNKCLDFSCGYGQHLLKFKDFVGCDINRDCLTYLSVIYEQSRIRKRNIES